MRSFLFETILLLCLSRALILPFCFEKKGIDSSSSIHSSVMLIALSLASLFDTVYLYWFAYSIIALTSSP